jgi:hypothetical protein
MYTLLELRRYLARTVDSYVAVTATGGSTTTIVDTNLLDSGEFPDESLIGATAYVANTTDGLAPKGSARYVTDFDNTTGTLTVGHAFPAAIDPGDTIDLYTRYSLDELNTALMIAVRDWRLIALTTEMTPGVYAVTGNGLHDRGQIRGVWYRYTANEDFKPIYNYTLFQDADTITLNLPVPIPSAVLRVEYEARYDQLKSGSVFDDTKVVGGDLEYHLLFAQAHLFRIRMQRAAGPDRDWYASLYREAIERLERNEPVRVRAGRAKINNWRETVVKRYSPPFW